MAIKITSSDIFNAEQLACHSKIYAGPGAGKTHFLVENVKNIVTTNPFIAQSRARRVLCITYTNAAVDEIKRRLDNFADYIEVYTIHGFIIENIIKPFQDDLRAIMKSDFRIDVNNKGVIASQIEGLGILHGIDKDEIYEFIKKTNSNEFASDDFNYSKKVMGEVEVDNDVFLASLANGVSRQMKFKASSKINEKHISPLKKYVWSSVRKLTHNEILYFGYRILESNPTALYAIRVKFPFIFVDEFQDTNPLQTLLIKLIGQKSTVVGVVGDIAQSIYSFQGAHPSDFENFSIDGERELKEYNINDNRRSTENIVNFCNFLRQSDQHVVQISKRLYDTEDAKEQSESKKIHFLIGATDKIQSSIQDVLKNGGVVLSRTWADAFDYVQDIDEPQASLLKKIYNSYYTSPIQIREEIVGHNNVTWVRAFRFILGLWESYLNGSFVDIIQSLTLYVDIDPYKLTPKILFQIKRLSENIFNNIDDHNQTCSVIKGFNTEIQKAEYIDFRQTILGTDFEVPVFDEFDREQLVEAVNGLFWDTSYKLFKQVFSDNSKYMTVHQAKGLEWDKVVVSVMPNTRRNGISIASLYSSPCLTKETPADEFTRMYYVACSRAKEDLYIHIPSGCTKSEIESALKTFCKNSKQNIAYEIIT